MEDKERNIEDLFRRKLEGFEIKATEADWDAIKGKMPLMPAKRRFAWWYWLTGITGVLVALFMIFKPMNSSQTLTFTNPVSVSEPEGRTSKNVESTTNQQDQKIKPQNKVDKSVDLTNMPQTPGNTISGKQSKAKGTKGNQNDGGNSGNASTSSGNVNDNAETGKSNESNHKTHSPKVGDKSVEAGKPVEIIKPAKEDRPEMLVLDVSPRLPKFNWMTFDVMALNLIGLNNPPFVMNKVPDDKSNPMNLNFAVGPAIGMNRYTQTTSSKDADYTKYRNGIEKPVIMPDLGLQIIGKYNNLIFNSGLILSFKGQQTNSLVNHRIYDSVPVLNPDSVLIDYFRFNYRDTTTKLTGNNRYSYLEIPLNIGYAFKINDRNSISLTGGATLSMLTGSKGRIIAANAPNYTLAETDNNDLFSYNRLLASWQATIGHNYQLTKTITWNTTIQYRSTLGNVYGKDFPVKMNWNNVGINTSLTFKIGR